MPRPTESTEATVSCVHCGQEHPASWSHCPHSGGALGSGEALIGRIVGGRYDVVSVLGKGGMGTVYLARDMQHDEVAHVALKRLHPELARDLHSVRRFQREAAAATATGHPNVVAVLDSGFGEDGAPYIVMERLKGQSLDNYLARHGSVLPGHACRIMRDALAGLAAVHSAGIIHRDLKPDNIYLASDRGERRVKLLDFGVSKVTHGEAGETQLTRTGAMVGTPSYMSPEIARGRPDIDHRVDLYAAGVILYECLSGELPFRGSNYHALLQAILGGAPTPLGTLVSGLPDGLSDVVHKSFARDREHRYQSAEELRDALAPFTRQGAYETPIGDRMTPSAPFSLSSPPGREITGRFHDTLLTPRGEEPTRTDAPPPFDTGPRPIRRPGGGHPDGTVKGTWCAEALRVLRDANGNDKVDEWISALAMPYQDCLRGILLRVGVAPVDALDGLLRRAARDVGDEAIARVGAAIASAELPRGPHVVRSASPGEAVCRAPDVWRAYHSFGEVVTMTATANHARIEHRHQPRLDGHDLAMVGFYRRLVQLCGGRDTTCQLEPDPRGASVFILRWK